MTEKEIKQLYQLEKITEGKTEDGYKLKNIYELNTSIREDIFRQLILEKVNTTDMISPSCNPHPRKDE